MEQLFFDLLPPNCMQGDFHAFPYVSSPPTATWVVSKENERIAWSRTRMDLHGYGLGLPLTLAATTTRMLRPSRES